MGFLLDELRVLFSEARETTAGDAQVFLAGPRLSSLGRFFRWCLAEARGQASNFEVVQGTDLAKLGTFRRV